jgi:hypothetical protein
VIKIDIDALKDVAWTKLPKISYCDMRIMPNPKEVRKGWKGKYLYLEKSRMRTLYRWKNAL